MEMELFTVNRYDTEKKPHDPDREKKILSDLQKSIRKRKRKIKETQEQDQQSIDDNVKAKKHKDNIEDSTLNDKPTIKNTEISKKYDDLKDSDDEKKQAKKNPFAILGEHSFAKNAKIDMILPHWLAQPAIISSDLSPENRTPLNEISYLSQELQNALAAMNIERLFPVQESVIPWVLDVHSKPIPFRPRDICVSAPTGSGKTLAYAVPIVQLLSNRLERKIRALVVLPVAELAAQVFKVFQKLCEHTKLSVALLSKTIPFDKEQSLLVEQFNGKWYSKIDILIATTGRLVEHIHSTPGFSLKSLKILVMDEADRIMEQVHNNWLYHLDSHVKEHSDALLIGRPLSLCFSELCYGDASKQPHKMLFSATLSQDPEKLQSLQLFQPKLFTAIVSSFSVGPPKVNDLSQTTTMTTEVTPMKVEETAAVKVADRRGDFVGKFTTPAELTEKYCLTQAELKPLSLYTLITEQNWKRFLCFTNSGEAAHRLSFVLQFLFNETLKIEELSSGLSANLRSTILQKFQAGKIDGLICSDALARGIDIHDVDIVISYDAPRHVKTYIHRIGRTARAGRLGLAVTLVTRNELNGFKKIISDGGKLELEELKIMNNTEEIMAKEYANAVEHMQAALKREIHNKITKATNEKNSKKIPEISGSVIGQLQSQVQNQTVFYSADGKNMPESWKWENQQNINERKERKRKNNKKKEFKNKAK